MYDKEIEEELRAKFPKFEVRQKKDSLFMKFLGWALLIITFGKNKRFMEFFTTVGYTIYVPEFWHFYTDTSKASVLVHEGRHMWQMEEYGGKSIFGRAWFGLKYLLWPFPLGYANFRLEMEVDAKSEEIVYVYKVFSFPLWGRGFDRAISVLSGPEYFWPTFSRDKVSRLLRASIMKKLKEMK